MAEQSYFNRHSRKSGGSRPARFSMPNLSPDDLEILKQEMIVRSMFGEEGVERFWEELNKLAGPLPREEPRK